MYVYFCLTTKKVPYSTYSEIRIGRVGMNANDMFQNRILNFRFRGSPKMPFTILQTFKVELYMLGVMYH